MMNVTVHQAKKTVGKRTILDVRDLLFPEASIVMVIGPNGAGKTTLLQTISNIDQTSTRDIDYGDQKQISLSQVNHMVQHSYLFDLSVEENLRWGGRGLPDVQARIDNLIEQLDMNSLRNEKCRNLSGGEAQKVAFARTLLSEKPLIILDEPTSAMDVAATKRCEELILALNREKKISFIMTTHNPSQALRIGSLILIMDQGKVVEAGNPEHFLHEALDPIAQAYLENWRLTHV
jgi:ABC-type multidrug transport system ATPase subunit